MRLILYFILSLAFFVTKPVSSYGQDESMPYHKIFSVEDGLPSNRIYDIIQDKKGNIWIGTDNGLLKFNGKTFKEYTTVESVSSEYSFIHELKDGSIWCLSFGNQIFKVSDDSLKVIDAFKPYINDTKYFKLFESQDSLLYLETPNRIISYDPFENTTTKIANINKATILGIDHQNIIYSYRDKHDINQISFNLENKNEKQINSNFQVDKNIKMFYDDQNSYAFIFSNNGGTVGHIYLFDPSQPQDIVNSNPIISFPKAGHHSLNHISTTYGVPWVSTPKGAINTKTKKCFFPEKCITKVIVDYEGNYWMSTYNSGIIFIPNLNIKQQNKIPLEITQIEVIDSIRLLVYSEDGYVHILNSKNSKIENTFFIDKKSDRRLPILKGTTKLLVNTPEPFILNLKNGHKTDLKGFLINLKSFQTIDDNIIIKNGSNHIIIYHNDVFDKKKPTLATLDLSKKWVKNNTQTTSPNNLFGSYSKNYNLFQQNLNIESIHYETLDKRLWIAHTNSTSIEQHQILKDFKTQENENIKLNCFANYLDKGVVAGLRNYGIVFIEGDEIIHTVKDGLYKEFGPIREIITTDSLIISLAEKGTIISDIYGDPLYTIDETDGLKGSIINDIQVLSKSIWFATNKGLYHVLFDDLHDNITTPLIQINHLSVDNKKTDNPFMDNSFPNNSDIEINFEAFCYKGRNVFEYQYQLHDNDEWLTLPSTASSVRLPNLSSGKYQFKIKAINEENIASKIIQLNFSVLPPTWLRWWFILGTMLFVLLALYLYNKRNLEKIEKENQLEKERIEKENQWEQEIRTNKLSALQSRMNPHFIFNSLNSIQDFIIRLDKEGANEYLGIFSDLMRIYLTHSEKDKIDLYEETEALKLYLKLEELRFPEIKVDFKIVDDLKNMDIMIPPLFIQPYIENAFKHGLLHKKDDKLLKIEFSYLNNHLIIDIEDNGVGREKVKEIQNKTLIKGLSYSTKANETRLELLNHNREKKLIVKTIDLFKDNIPSGTAIKIHIPISNE